MPNILSLLMNLAFVAPESNFCDSHFYLTGEIYLLKISKVSPTETV